MKKQNFIKKLKTKIRKNEKKELKVEKQYSKVSKQYDNSKDYGNVMKYYLKMIEIRQYLNYLLRLRIEYLKLLNDMVR